MANKNIKGDFDDMQFDEEFDFDFGEEEFEEVEKPKPKKKKGKKKGKKKRRTSGHALFFLVVIIVLIACVISLLKWNKGEVIDIDPNEDTSEFDVEPNDIHPFDAR